jgi:hypothetical protein
MSPQYTDRTTDARGFYIAGLTNMIKLNEGVGAFFIQILE